MEDAYVRALAADLAAQGIEGDEIVGIVGEVTGLEEGEVRSLLWRSRAGWAAPILRGYVADGYIPRPADDRSRVAPRPR